VPPVYPDLIFFHVYRAIDPAYEEILREMRERTTAEIMISTHHIRRRDGGDREAVDAKESETIRALSVKYGCELVDVERSWLATLEARKQEPRALLRDGVHLNREGLALMAKLVSAHLQEVKGAVNPMSDCIKDVPATLNDKGEYVLTFEGNRVDVVFDAVPGMATPGTAAVLLDGKPLSAFETFRQITRPSSAPKWRTKPAIKRVSHDNPLLLEDWTVTVTKGEDGVFSFHVAGSKTGPDGSGTSDKRFVSESGRVVLDSEDWILAWCLKHKKQTLPKDFKITWSVKPLYIIRNATRSADSAGRPGECRDALSRRQACLAYIDNHA